MFIAVELFSAAALCISTESNSSNNASSSAVSFVVTPTSSSYNFLHLATCFLKSSISSNFASYFDLRI